jgi:proteic killer suppression protein
MIISWKNNKLQKFFKKGVKKGIDAKYAKEIKYLLTQLDKAECPNNMDIMGYDFHALKGDKAGLYAVKVSANYRLTFGFHETNVVEVNLEDYH